MASQKYIYVQSSDAPGGLHCLNLETGVQVWYFNADGNTRGHTPAVDQANGFVYFQTRNRLWKLDALTGSLIDFVAVSNPSGSGMGSGNTLLINDANGYYISGVWNDYVAYGGGVKVHDINLDLVWQVTGLNLSLKTIMAYNDGVLFVGRGCNFSYPEQEEWYGGELEDAGITAYDITDGTELWKYTCDSEQLFINGSQRGVIDCIYCNGYIVFHTTFETTTEVYVLNATTGALIKKIVDVSAAHSACAPSVLSGGRLFDGSLTADTVRVWQLGTGDYKDWNTFGYTPQVNHNIAHADALKTIAEDASYLNDVEGGDQGGVIQNGIAYFIKNNNLVIFNPVTLVVSQNISIGSIYDMTPLLVNNLADKELLLIRELNGTYYRITAIDIATGNREWNGESNLSGNLFFGMNYYESVFSQLIKGISGEGAIGSINTNFAALNALIDSAAIIVTITSAIQWDDINANIASLNTNGVAVAVAEITIGMTGTQFNNLINNFVTDFNAANS